MKEFVVVLAVGFGGCAFGAAMACLTFALSLSPRQWWTLVRRWWQRPQWRVVVSDRSR